MKTQRLILVLWALIAVSLNSYSQFSKSLSLSFESSFYKPKDYLEDIGNAPFLERFGFIHDIGANYLLTKNKSTFSFGLHYQRAVLNYSEAYIITAGDYSIDRRKEESYGLVALNLEYNYRIGQKNKINSFHLSFGLEVSYAFHYQKRKEAYKLTQYDPSSTKPLLERDVLYVNYEESNFEVNRYGLKQVFLRPRAGLVYSRRLNNNFAIDIGSNFILGSVINQEFETDFGTPHYDNGDFRDWWSISLRVGLRYSL